MIAHRLGTIADADNIVVLDSGRVSANGTHDELMEKQQYLPQAVADEPGSRQLEHCRKGGG